MSKLSRSSVSLSTLMSLNSDDKKFGPPPESVEFLETALLLVQGGMSPTRAARHTGFGRSTVTSQRGIMREPHRGRDAHC